MTREEIIDFCEMKSQLEPENEDIFNYIIKALQEPCEDYISRQEVKKFVEYIQAIKDNHSEKGSPIDYGTICGIVIYGHRLLDLPPVIPTTCIAKVVFDKDELQKMVDEKVKELVTHGTCKDCKHCFYITDTKNRVCGKHSCMQVSNNWYCADFEKGGNKDDNNNQTRS